MCDGHSWQSRCSSSARGSPSSNGRGERRDWLGARVRRTPSDPRTKTPPLKPLGGQRLSTKAADVTVLFKEVDAAGTRISVRTTERADAVAITSAFGGGGHARAAGCTIAAPLDAAREQMLAECERELARSDAGGR